MKYQRGWLCTLVCLYQVFGEASKASDFLGCILFMTL